MSLRGLQHTKSNRIEISKGVPSPNEGNNGELRLGITSKGIFLYAKYGNRWYQLGDAAISSSGNFSPQGIASQGGGTLATSIDRGNQSLQMGGNVVLSGNTVSDNGSNLGIKFTDNNTVRVDVANTKIGTSGLVTLSDNTMATGNFEISSAGHLVLDVAATKEISLLENNGTYTPTSANHAVAKHYVDAMVYPGQILGYTYNHPSSLIFHLLTTSMTVEANTHFVTFDTPPSEKVEITVSAFFDRTSTSDVGVYMGLSLNSTYSQLGDEWAYDFNSGIGNSDDEADDRYENVKFVLQAAELEAVGVSNTVYIGLASTDSSAVYLRYGHAGGRTYPPMIIKAVALPASINEE